MNKIIFVALLGLMTSSLCAQTNCEAKVKASVIQKESEHTKVKPAQVKISEFRQLGNGGLLALYSLFVDGPKTGDNTHWEIVAEIKTCKTLLGRRYWAH